MTWRALSLTVDPRLDMGSVAASAHGRLWKRKRFMALDLALVDVVADQTESSIYGDAIAAYSFRALTYSFNAR